MDAATSLMGRKKKVMMNEAISLSSRNWKEFVFGDEFSIYATGSGIDKNKLNSEKGIIPYVTRTDLNNGIDMFIGQQTKRYNIDNGNVITIGLDTQTVFYQPVSFYTGQNIQIIRHESLDRYNAIFLIVTIKKLVEKFSWGSYGATLTRLKKSRLYLPSTDSGEIDFKFMSSFMKYKEQEILRPIIDKLCKQLIINNITGGGKFSYSQWKAFYFTEVFTEIQRGKRLKKADHAKGKSPYVSSTSLNNGVDGFIGNESGVRIFSNCITIANSGSVGSAFFHRYAFIASDHVTELKRDGLDKYTYLFMLPLINRLSEKYSFNREINDERIKREKLLLPVNDNGEIDFTFMSSFMQNVEHDILNSTLKMFSSRSNVNKSKRGGG